MALPRGCKIVSETYHDGLTFPASANDHLPFDPTEHRGIVAVDAVIDGKPVTTFVPVRKDVEPGEEIPETAARVDQQLADIADGPR